MAKAALHASHLAQLACARCDARCALEAEAYCAWLRGSALLEKGTEWDGATFDEAPALNAHGASLREEFGL